MGTRLTAQQRADRAWSEKAWQAHVLDMATKCGWTWWHFHDSRRQIRPGVFVGDRDSAGFPDLVLCHPRGGVWFVELKKELGKVKAKQRESLEALRLAGARAQVWRPSSLPWVEEVLTLRILVNRG